MKRHHLPATVWILGLVSLFTDMASELVHSLLPLWLAGPLGASALTIGLIEGASEALPPIVKIFSGYLSDVIGRRKPLVLAGYGLAALAKPLFPLASTVGPVFAARMIDRFGKGLRGAPRDALISDITPADRRGAAFGLRQSLDTIGAVIGPLVAVGLMVLLSDNIRHVLWFATLPGILAVSILIFGVREPVASAPAPARLPFSRAGFRRLGPAFWKLVLIGAIVSLARFSEAFLVLRAAASGIELAWVPMVMVVMAIAYVITAYPAGRLSDAIGRKGILLAGLSVLIVTDLLLAWRDGPWLVFVGVALWGVHMGLTQGILATLVADTSPAEYRGTAFGVFNFVTGISILLASVAAGGFWQWLGPSATFLTGAVLAALALTATGRLLPAD